MPAGERAANGSADRPAVSRWRPAGSDEVPATHDPARACGQLSAISHGTCRRGVTNRPYASA
jgi:hypothetical protein